MREEHPDRDEQRYTASDRTTQRSQSTLGSFRNASMLTKETPRTTSPDIGTKHVEASLLRHLQSLSFVFRQGRFALPLRVENVLAKRTHVKIASMWLATETCRIVPYCLYETSIDCRDGVLGNTGKRRGPSVYGS